MGPLQGMPELTQLHTGPGVSISDYACKCRRGGPAEEETSSTNDVVFVRRGVFRRNVLGREEIADANHVVFFRQDEPYRISHPTDLGDDCTVVSLEPRLCSDALSEYGADRHLTESLPFGETSRPVTPVIYYHHWRLLRLITMKAPGLTIDEAALDLVRLVFEYNNPVRACSRRAQTRNAHRELANEARFILNTSLV